MTFHFFCELELGLGTNNWPEFRVLVAWLRVVLEKGIHSIQNFVDSKLSKIDWINENSILHNIFL
jgi:hypothetical protein